MIIHLHVVHFIAFQFSSDINIHSIKYYEIFEIQKFKETKKQIKNLKFKHLNLNC